MNIDKIFDDFDEDETPYKKYNIGDKFIVGSGKTIFTIKDMTNTLIWYSSYQNDNSRGTTPFNKNEFEKDLNKNYVVIIDN